MSNSRRKTILVIGVLQLILILSIANLPFILENFVPGEYRLLLPDFINKTLGDREDYLPAVSAVPIEVEASDLIADLGVEADDVVEEESALAEVEPTQPPEQVAAIAEEETEEDEVEEEVENTPTPVATSTPIPPTPTFTPTPSPTPLPMTFRINGLVNEPQNFNNCGPTNLSIMLRFYGDGTTQEEAAAYLKPNREDRNVSPWQVSDYVNDFTNLRSITRSNGNQELLRELIVAGFPVVIEKGYDPDAANSYGWYGHYLIVFGYDSSKEEYNTIDTFLGPFTEKDVKQPGYTLEDGFIYSYEYIAEYWQQFNYTFYVVYEAEREDELYAILGDDIIYAEDNWTASAIRAQKDIDADPDNPFAWFNLGTSLTELGKKTKKNEHYQNAAVAFDKALEIGLPSRMLWYQHGPFVAYNEIGRHEDALSLADATLVDPGGRTIEEVYLHKGHSLSYLQDLPNALIAYNQALRLNENFYPAQWAKDYTESVLDG
ncbi:MAG: C39 family peptidase [Chloroflexota bacterium]